ncbi:MULTISPECIES: hypothetical protein [unclassified Bradyrhizobium]|uniref:hypothetical protein n=1 Tax=unclassified Bradyrhizobium TaxID=2631580 RepID=UPI00339B95EC
MKILPKPERNKFIKPVESATKPFGIVAETLNTERVDYHRAKNYTREQYYIHVSDLIQSASHRKFCARQHALTYIEENTGTYVRKVSPGMSLLHTFGHATQDHLTRDFIKRSAHGDKVWGNWRCVCGYTHFVMQTRPVNARCEKCEHPVDIYVEIDLKLAKYRIVGHPDLFLLWGKTLHLYEIKSIERAGVDFETMDAPLGDHTLQNTFYYWMLRDMVERGELKGLDVSSDLNYLYVDRSMKKLFSNRVYKEFTKRASPGDRIKPMLENAKLVKDSLDKNVLPTRICDGPNTPRAKACNVCVSCFLRKKDTLHA